MIINTCIFCGIFGELTMLSTVGIHCNDLDMLLYIFGCFGTMSVISLDLLQTMYSKYSLNNLIGCINCREDRCALERVFSIICLVLCGDGNMKTIHDDIRNPFNVPLPFKMNFDIYNLYKQELQSRFQIVKIWCGR